MDLIKFCHRVHAHLHPPYLMVGFWCFLLVLEKVGSQSTVVLTMYQNSAQDNWLSTVRPTDTNYANYSTLGSCYGSAVTGTKAIYEYTYSLPCGNPNNIQSCTFHYYTIYLGETQSGHGTSYTFMGVPCYVYHNDTPITGTHPIYQYTHPDFNNTWYATYVPDVPQTYNFQKFAWYMLS